MLKYYFSNYNNKKLNQTCPSYNPLIRFVVLHCWGQDDGDDSEEEDDTPAYRDLISIRAGKPKGKLKNCLVDHNQVRRLSLSEQELEDIAKNHGTDIVRWLINFNNFLT